MDPLSDMNPFMVQAATVVNQRPSSPDLSTTSSSTLESPPRSLFFNYLHEYTMQDGDLSSFQEGLPSTSQCHCQNVMADEDASAYDCAGSSTNQLHGMKKMQNCSPAPQKASPKYDHHEMCTLEECDTKKCTNALLADYLTYSEWKCRIREIEAKIDETQKVHISMLLLTLKLYLYSLTGRVTNMSPTKLRHAYSRFKNLLDSFSSLEICEELLRRLSSSQDCVVALLARCWIRAHVMQHHHEAIEIVSLLIEQHSLSPQELCFSHFTRGRLQHMYLGDVDMALHDYNKAVDAFTYFSDVYNNRGNIYADYFGETELALQDYNKAISLDSSFYLAYDNRGELYEEDFGDLSKALEDYTMALKYNPNYLTAHQNRVNLLFRINKTNMIGNI